MQQKYRNRRQEASIKGRAQFVSKARAEAKSKAKRARQASRITAPPKGRGITAAAKSSKARAKARMQDALSVKGGPSAPQFTPISVAEAVDAFGNPLPGVAGPGGAFLGPPDDGNVNGNGNGNGLSKHFYLLPLLLAGGVIYFFAKKKK